MAKGRRLSLKFFVGACVVVFSSSMGMGMIVQTVQVQYRANVAFASTQDVQHATSTAIAENVVIRVTLRPIDIEIDKTNVTNGSQAIPASEALHVSVEFVASAIPVTYAPLPDGIAITPNAARVTVADAMSAVETYSTMRVSSTAPVTPLPFPTYENTPAPTAAPGSGYYQITATPTPYPVQTISPSWTPIPTQTDTPQPTPSDTPQPPKATAVPPPPATDAPTVTPLPLPTVSPSVSPSLQPSSSSSPQPTQSATSTPEPTATITPTNTALPTSTDTPTIAATPTPIDTDTPTATLPATDTITPAPIETETPTPQLVPTAFLPVTIEPTVTDTPTMEATPAP